MSQLIWPTLQPLLEVTINTTAANSGESSNAQSWANAFRDAFQGMSPQSLDGVQFRDAVTLGTDFIGVIYNDRFGILTGRIYEVAMLRGTSLEPSDAINVAASYIYDCVEPSPPGHVLDLPLLAEINARFPGIRWWGDPGLETHER